MASPGEMQCPHCRKTFSADLLGQETARAGYKCPHCKLFVPLGRAEDPRQTDAA
jgi:DNA-directed RNA polymerase subunit RPC12/RpoP